MRFKITFFSLLFFGCISEQITGNKIIDECIEASGSDLLKNAEMSFYFRNIKYQMSQLDGKYSMSRIVKDTSKSIYIKDIVDNTGFERYIENKKIQVADSMASKYTNSINSVFYFAFLPSKLNDFAVVKTYLGEESIEGNLFDKVEVTFKKENGGEDYHDVFNYWIAKETKQIGYLAYIFHTNDGGMRFRKAINPRYVNGVLVLDYINYKPKNDILIENIAKEYQNGNLIELSQIKLDSLTIKLYN